MILRKLLITVPLVLATVGCSHKSWQIAQSHSDKIAIDSTTQSLADHSYVTFLQPVKSRIDSQMNEVIGTAAETMRSHAPESLLSNFNADVYRHTAENFSGQPVDIAIVNLGGLRTAIPAGKITVRKIFELMPFENELVILWLKGRDLSELLQIFAKAGGEGVAGLHMDIRNGQAENISIGGKPLDPDKTYSIATNDYLAGGNDKMTPLARYAKRENTGLKIRNILISYIREETRKGNTIQSKLDGRTTVLQ